MAKIQKDTSVDATVEPQEQGSGTLGKLVSYIRPFWGTLILVAVLSIAGSVLNVFVPTFTKNIVNETSKGIGGTFDVEAIISNASITVILLLASFVCNLIQSFVSPKLSQKTAQKMRTDLNEKSNRIPLNYFDTTPTGDTLSTMTNDIDTVSTSFSSTLPSLASALATAIGCVILMFVTNATLAVTTILATVLGMLLSVKVLSMGSESFTKNQALLGSINAQVNEDINGFLIIKSFNAEKDAIAAFDAKNAELYESTWKSQLVTVIMMPLSTFANNLSYILVCIIGAYLVFTGSTEIGTIIAFISYAQLIASPVSTITQSAGSIQPALAAGDRIFAVLEQDEMTDDGKTTVAAEQTRGAVDFDHVRFGYVPTNIIVHDFSAHVEPGQKIAIVGPTGAGKSTLINLLERFYEIDGGDIRIDGTSIYDMSRETLHKLISMVLQETWTFEGSIRDNIVYSNKDVSDAALWEVVRNCGLEEFVRSSEGGLDAVLAEDADVSAGQKQLITIARAMIDDAPILILDEATSSVDTRTEAIISAAIDKLMEGRTSFVIAHRLSTIRNADMIIVLKDGDVLELGTHDELMAKKGFYADLYMSQFDNGQQEEV